MPIRLLPLLVLIAAFAGWNQAHSAGRAATPTKNDNAHLSDAQIEGLIRTKLAKSKMAPEGFTVHVHNRVATWEGKTNVIQHKGVATRMAKTAGATSVVNNIKISEEARRKAAEKLAMSRTHTPVEKASVVQ